MYRSIIVRRQARRAPSHSSAYLPASYRASPVIKLAHKHNHCFTASLFGTFSSKPSSASGPSLSSLSRRRFSSLANDSRPIECNGKYEKSISMLTFHHKTACKFSISCEFITDLFSRAILVQHAEFQIHYVVQVGILIWRSHPYQDWSLMPTPPTLTLSTNTSPPSSVFYALYHPIRP